MQVIATYKCRNTTAGSISASFGVWRPWQQIEIEYRMSEHFIDGQNHLCETYSSYFVDIEIDVEMCSVDALTFQFCNGRQSNLMGFALAPISQNINN